MYDEWNKYDAIQPGKLYKVSEKNRKGIYPDYVYVIEINKSRFGQIPNIKVIAIEEYDYVLIIHGGDFIDYYEVIEDG